MIKVGNKKAISNLANKSFKANRTRNVIAIIAISLTALLFTSLFTMGMGTVESLQQATMRQAGGDGHAVLKYITDEQFDTVKDHPLIKEIAYNRTLCDSVENEELIKRRAEFWYYDDVGFKLGFCDPTTGHRPEAENEVIADTKTLELLGVPLELGSPITLELNIRGEMITREFVLCGWWESDPVFNIGQFFSSRAYVDAHIEELENTFYTDNSMTGVICAYMMFNNSLNLESKLESVITDSGFSSNEDSPNYISSNVNWSYLSTNFGMDAQTAVILVSGLLLIIFTGYLIIYNIFQISVIQDIRFYGLLKTIGTTGKQIRRIIRRQALVLSAIGIPIGLLLGFFCGKALVPLLISNSNFAGSAVSVSPDPLIFVGAALFALITVFISTLKPGRVAASVSPVEAVRFTGCDDAGSFKQLRSTKGAKVSQMAGANMSRNKKRTVLVVISLALSLILMNVIVTLSQSIDMDKYLSTFNDTDFLIAHADYFNNDFVGPENELSEQLIETVQGLEGFEDGGRIFGGRTELFTANDTDFNLQYNTDSNGDPFCAVYGLEDLPMQRLKLLDGEFDLEKLKSGKYILEGVRLDDNSKPEWDTAHFKNGETVTLHNYKGTSDAFADREYTTQEYTVLGHVAIKHYTCSDRTGWEYNFYLPAEVYKPLLSSPAVMSYAFNVKDGYSTQVENFLEKYTDSVEPLMNFDSKAKSETSFEGLRDTVLYIGGALGIIIGIIGVLNFVNAVLTSIITRRREFAMLQSIGMTRKQLRQMLCCEGLYYALFTGLAVIIFGIVCSLVIVRAICAQLWFMSFSFVFWPLAVSLPILAVLGFVIPLVAYRSTDTQSIVERLREAE
ncbi:MAG: ABC transporter permease [Firmicutes bacterium HGW-Firmicutes-16]|nr:MAG: ABC transporter permease [Firmicutes bacterium HGW-Firmicutes-16]